MWLAERTVYFDLRKAWLIGWLYVHALLCPNTVVMGTEEMETKQVFFSSDGKEGESPISLNAGVDIETKVYYLHSTYQN